MARTTRTQRRLVLLLAVALSVLILISGAFQWSPLNCWHDEIDISSGMVRHTRYVLFVRIGERTESTWLSSSLPVTDGEPQWHRVNTFSPGVRHSPHYRYHGAINQIGMLEKSEQFIPFDSDARQHIARKVLELWKNTGSDYEAGQFVEKVATTALVLHEKGVPKFTAQDFPET